MEAVLDYARNILVMFNIFIKLTRECVWVCVCVYISKREGEHLAVFSERERAVLERERVCVGVCERERTPKKTVL